MQEGMSGGRRQMIDKTCITTFSYAMRREIVLISNRDESCYTCAIPLSGSSVDKRPFLYDRTARITTSTTTPVLRTMNAVINPVKVRTSHSTAVSPVGTDVEEPGNGMKGRRDKEGEIDGLGFETGGRVSGRELQRSPWQQQ